MKVMHEKARYRKDKITNVYRFFLSASFIRGSCVHYRMDDPDRGTEQGDGSVQPDRFLLLGPGCAGKKELPDAFLRRCIFHYIAFPDSPMMAEIVRVHYPDLQQKLVNQAIEAFYWIRSIGSLQKKPSTSELLDWVQALAIGGVSPDQLTGELPFLGVLLKKDRDFEHILRQLHNQGPQKKTSGAGFRRSW